MATLNDLTQNLTLQKDDGPITAVRLVKGYDNSYALNAAGRITALSLGDSKLKKLTLGVEAEALEYLYLSGSKSLKEVVFEVPLPQLRHLYLNNCTLVHITFPAGFKALQQIYLQKNSLQQLVFEGDCPSLVLVDVSENQLEELIFSAGFSALRYLYASNNVLQKMVFNRSMRLLNTLHLSQNQLTELPPFLSEVETMETLYLKGNQLGKIDREVWDTDGNCWNTMKGYLTSLNKAKFTKEYLHEAKMILIGNGEVGKTSIRLKLLDIKAKLPDKQDRTPGLDVVPYTISNLAATQTGLSRPTSFTFNIWDFGGQGKYREIQQLFCSRKSLYLYVTSHDDTADHEEVYVGYEYWLAMANAYNNDSSQNSPVIYVQNKIDIGEQPINETDVKNKFSNVGAFIKISCVDTEQFTVLPKLIAKSISKISDDVFTVQYSSEWLGVKEDLNDLKNKGTNYISKEEFITICTARGLDADEIKSWLAVLDRIGTVIYFGENEKLRDWIVLNPIWVKDAICKVIDFKFYNKKIATLEPDFLPEIWEKYEEEERKKLLELLLAYDFCYEENGSFIVPALFSEKQPPYPGYLSTFDCEIKLKYFPFLPAGTLHKFMVKLHDKIYNELRWKKGVVLHEGPTNTYAEVIESWKEHSIYIQLKGPKGLHSLWKTIQETFQELNEKLKTTKFINNLGFEVYCFHNKEWKSQSHIKELCELDDKNIFRFMFDLTGEDKNLKSRGFGKENEPLKKMIDNSKPYEVTMVEDARTFVPFSEVEGFIKLLFLTATPMDTGQLNTGRESRFKDLFRYFDAENRFLLKEEHGITTEQFQNFVIYENPHIVHYGGHGEKEGVVLEDENLEADILSGILQLSEKVQCVVLNACNSLAIAETLAQDIPYVIATQDVIDDRTSIAFAKGFYMGVVAGKTIENAFKLGILAVKREKLPDADVLILVKGTPAKA